MDFCAGFEIHRIQFDESKWPMNHGMGFNVNVFVIFLTSSFITSTARLLLELLESLDGILHGPNKLLLLFRNFHDEMYLANDC